MVLLYLPIILVILYYTLRYYFTRTFDYWKKRYVLGPEPVPVFGNLKDSALRRKNMGVVYHEMYDAFPDEKVIGIYRMTTPCLLVRDLDIIKHIMIKDFDLFTDRGVEFSKEGLGANLFHADGDTWRALRNRFLPLFTSGKLRNMYYLIQEQADKFIDYVSNECLVSKEYEVHTLIQKFTIASISSCAFGVDIDMHDNKLDALTTFNKVIFKPRIIHEVNMMFPGILKKLNLCLFLEPVKIFFADLVKNVIDQREGKPSNRNDFMDLILELRQSGVIQSSKFGDENKLVEITDDVIIAQAFVFYTAGFETSATTMSYLLHEIAVNPHIQEKLLTEIDESLKANDGKITYDSLKDMKYLNKVFSETLRLHSLVEPLQRKANADYKIPGTDIVIRKGQVVFVSPRAIHYDKKYYPNPEVFDPERFNPEVADNRHPCAYIPFGTGPRSCIGVRFGKLQSYLCIAKLLSKFRVEPSKRTPKILPIDPNKIVIAPKDGIYLKFVARN